MKEERTKKMLRFSPTTKETAFFSVLGKPHTSTLRKLWFERCRTNQHEQFIEDLAIFESKGITARKFFEKEGWTILNRAIVSSTNVRELKSIYQFMPKELFVKILCEDNYSILHAFMLGATAIERNGYISTSDLEERYEKIRLLIGLRDVEIISYLEKMLKEGRIGETLKAQFQHAATQLNFRPIMA
jgi:hypothetical protein